MKLQERGAKCPDCGKVLTMLTVSLEAIVSATYDLKKHAVVDIDTFDAEVDENSINSYECPHCRAEIELVELEENNPDICRHETTSNIKYIDGTILRKCCVCHENIEFIPARRAG